MSAESEAYSVLVADAPVTALVADRVYPDFVPLERDLPAIAITRTDTEPMLTIHDAAPIGYDVTLEVWCLADGRAAAEALADAAEAALAAARFAPINRIPEYDPDAVLWATVITVVFWQEP